MPKNKEPEIDFNTIFSELAQDVSALIAEEEGSHLNILEFKETEVDLGIDLTKQQELVLKVLYNLELDEEDISILEYWQINQQTNWSERIVNPSMLILEAGRRCITSDTVLFTEKGMLQLKELDIPIEENKWTDLEVKVKQNNNEINPTSAVIYTGFRPCKQLRTVLGLELTATPEHRLLTFNKDTNKEEWKEVAELSATDFLVLQRGQNYFPTTKVSIPLEFDSPKFKFPNYVNTDFAKLCGIIQSCYVGIDQAAIGLNIFTDDSSEILNVLSHFYSGNIIGYTKRNKFFLEFRCSELIRYFQSYGICCRSVFNIQKEVFYFIRASSRDVQIHFLKGVFLAKGYIKAGVIYLRSSNHDFLKHIQLMLLNLNILSERINFCKPRKGYYKRYQRNPQLVISEPFSVQQFINLIGYDIEKFNKVYHHIRHLDFDPPTTKIYDRINSISYITNKAVYDIEVPVNNNYLANGIVSHNSGKSTLASLIACYEFYCLSLLKRPQLHYGIASSTPIGILVLATTADQAKKTIFRQVIGILRNSRYFKRLEDKGDLFIGKEEVALNSKNLYLYSGNSRSGGQVGGTLKCLIMDEVARFSDADGSSNALTLWSNLGISCAPFKSHAKLIAISSAWCEGDAIQILFNRAVSSDNTFALKAKSWELNPIHAARDNPIVVSFYETNPIEAAIEFEGIRPAAADPFLDANEINSALCGSSLISARRIINESTNLVELEIVEFPYQGTSCYVHIDPAISRDSYALAFGHGQSIDNKLTVFIDGILLWEPDTNHNVSIMNVQDIIKQIHNRMPIIKVTADHYNSAETLERLRLEGIKAEQVYFSNREQLLMYDNLRQLLHEQRIILPHNSIWSPILERELKQVQLLQGKKIDHPPKGGKDLADAVAAVAYAITFSDVRRAIHSHSRLNVPYTEPDNHSSSSYRSNVLNALKHRKRWTHDEMKSPPFGRKPDF